MSSLNFLKEKDILLDLKPTDKIDIINQIVKKLNIRNKKKVFNAILEREKLGTTAIGKGVALPHARSKLAKQIIAKFALFKSGVNFDALDGEKVNFIFLMVAPAADSPKYLKVLAHISRITNEKRVREALLSTNTKKEILKILTCRY